MTPRCCRLTSAIIAGTTLGIVQNNFRRIIRLGDGDEVKRRSPPAVVGWPGGYDFALTDSLRITAPRRVIRLRGEGPSEGRPLSRASSAAVSRSATTARSYGGVELHPRRVQDKQLEDLFVVLENGWWARSSGLPRRQEIEIRANGNVDGLSVRGIIRGRWEELVTTS